MGDFANGYPQLQYNTGTDATPTWTGTPIAFGGSNGANELRFAKTGGSQNGSTASSAWPYMTKPATGTAAVEQMWAFSSDASGSQVSTYDGANTNGRVFRWAWDNSGNMVSPPQFTCFPDAPGSGGHTTPVQGSQPGALSGSPIINGSTDTAASSPYPSYIKANAFGLGVDASGAQQTPVAGGGGGSYATDIRLSSLAVTSGSNGALSPATNSWLNNWQSLQGWLQYIANTGTPKTTGTGAPALGYWYFSLALYLGAAMSTGALTWITTFQYSYS